MAADLTLAALSGLHEAFDFMVALPGTFFFGGILDFADEKSVQAGVFLLPEQEAIGGEGIASRAARFLIVLLDAFGEREMNHGAHGGFVDAQTEGQGADHDAHFIGHPFFLVLAPSGAFHLAVIADGGDAVFLEEIDGVSHACDRGGINDDASVRNLPNGAKEQFILCSGVRLADDVTQIGAAKAGDVLIRIAEAELLDDVVADALRGAGREGSNRAVGKEFAETAELAVLGAEVVAPFGDAMGFVDGKEGDGHAPEPSGCAVEGDAFWREIEQAVVTFAGLTKDKCALVAGKRAIEKTGGDAHLLELRDLVLHERDERGDDDCGALGVEHGGQLVAERLAAARGHDHAGVAACGDAPDNAFLAWAEGFVAPVAVQSLEETSG